MEKGNTTNTLLIMILIIVVGYVVWRVADDRRTVRDDRSGSGIEIEIGDDNGGDSGNRGSR